MSLETLQCAAVAAATIIIEHKKTLSKTLDGKISGETEPEFKHPWRSQHG
jgi:hypothetical protein